MKIVEKMHEGGNRLARRAGLLSPLSQLFFLLFFLGLLSVMLLHRHWAIIWYALGVAWLNCRGWGCSKEHALSWTVDLMNVCTGAYPCLSKFSVSLKLRVICVSWVSFYGKETGLSSGMHLG